MDITGFVKRHPLPAHQSNVQTPVATRQGAEARLRLWLLLSAIGVVTIGAGATYWTFTHDMQVMRDRISAGSEIVQTRHGPLEYHVEGNGPPILVVHGAGGGYDHGMLIAQAYGGEGFRWIVPSRFGYLGSPLPADGSTAAQAEAFADLLDTLGIEQVGILAMSGGVPPSLQFARLYPERTSALVLLSSAPYTPLTAGDQKLPVPIWLYQALFKSDFPFWLLQKVAPRSVDTMFDVTPALRAELTPEEEVMVSSLVASFQPVTWRIKGLNNEGTAIDPEADYQMETISTPALVVHAEDDHINPIGIGEYTAAHLRGAQFLSLTTGGHLLLGHHAEVRTATNEFLRQHTTHAE